MTGRFLSVDPELGLVRKPQSWNRYSYAWGNPVVLIDRNGLSPRRFKDFTFKTYRYHFEYDVHGGPHVDISMKVGGQWQKIGRVDLDDITRKIPHMGKYPNIPRTALKGLAKGMRAFSWLGLALTILDADDLNADETLYDQDLARKLYGTASPDELSQEQVDHLLLETYRQVFGEDPPEDPGDPDDPE